jgi:hypothetical protein
MHFCLTIFSQDSYEKDKKGRKRLAVQGSQVDYTSLHGTKKPICNKFARLQISCKFDN